MWLRSFELTRCPLCCMGLKALHSSVTAADSDVILFYPAESFTWAKLFLAGWMWCHPCSSLHLRRWFSGLSRVAWQRNSGTLEGDIIDAVQHIPVRSDSSSNAGGNKDKTETAWQHLQRHPYCTSYVPDEEDPPRAKPSCHLCVLLAVLLPYIQHFQRNFKELCDVLANTFIHFLAS